MIITKSTDRIRVISIPRATVTYGMRQGAFDDAPAATMTAHSASGELYAVHITSDEIDRLTAARDAYDRETKHRGYPVT